MESFHLIQRCQTIKEESKTALPAISSTPPGKIRAGSGDVPSWLVAAALAVPPILFMLASRGNWLFDMGGADNWQYVKYFQAWDTDDLGMRERMDVNYKGSRVPWIVPGYLAHLLLGPDLGTIVLHATVLILSAWCLYLIVATFFQARIALLAAILAVGFPGFQASGVPGFWNYHGAAANLYLLVGLYFLAHSFSAERKDLLAMASGACLFTALLTTFIYAVQGPALIVFAATCWRRFGPQPLLRLVAMACLGALAITLAFALASWATGGRFWFFMAQWAFLGRAASNNLWAEPLGVWLPQAGWLSATLATAIASVAFLLVTMGLRSGEAWFSRAFIAQFWLAQLALIACDLFGQNAFQTSYVQYTAVASTFLALAGMAAVAFGASLAAVPAATLVHRRHPRDGAAPGPDQPGTSRGAVRTCRLCLRHSDAGRRRRARGGRLVAAVAGGRIPGACGVRADRHAGLRAAPLCLDRALLPLAQHVSGSRRRFDLHFVLGRCPDRRRALVRSGRLARLGPWLRADAVGAVRLPADACRPRPTVGHA